MPLLPIDPVYEDEHLLIVNKPAGLLCVPGLSDPDNLHDRVLKHNPNARVVHRLDMATSGLVIFALNHPAQKAMGKLFENRKIHKEYIAVLYGILTASFGEIELPLICDWEKRPKQKVDWDKGKSAFTQYERIHINDESTRVILRPITGRTHQLRVHMLALGHPILGDNFYFLNGSDSISDRLHLHAWQLRFKHPISGTPLTIQCPPEF